MKEMQKIHTVIKFEQEYPSSHYTTSGSEDETNASKNIEESQKSTNSTNTGTFSASPPDNMFKFKKPKVKVDSTVTEVNSETFAQSVL